LILALANDFRRKKKGPLTKSGPSLGRKRPRRATVGSMKLATALRENTPQRTKIKGKIGFYHANMHG
jgi:hypothetical protein